MKIRDFKHTQTNRFKAKRNAEGGINIYKFGALVLAIALFMLVIVGVGTSAKGTELIALESQINEVNNQNKEIQEKIVKESSLVKIQKEIGDGYAKPEQIVYVEQVTPVALNIK